MKTIEHSFKKSPHGYGHYKISVDVENINKKVETLYIITSDMRLIDKINSEDDSEAEEAKESAIKLILNNYDRN